MTALSDQQVEEAAQAKRMRLAAREAQEEAERLKDDEALKRAEAAREGERQAAQAIEEMKLKQQLV